MMRATPQLFIVYFLLIFINIFFSFLWNQEDILYPNKRRL